MTTPAVEIMAAILAGAAVVVATVPFDMRLKLAGLAAQYSAFSLLAFRAFPMQVAIGKSVIGACVVLGLALSVLRKGALSGSVMSTLPPGLAFRSTLAAFALLSGLGLSLRGWLPIPEITPTVSATASMLIIGGFVQIGFLQVGFGAGIGLLMALTGFDLALSHVEPSLAVVALFSLTHGGLGVATGYLGLHQFWHGTLGAEST